MKFDRLRKANPVSLIAAVLVGGGLLSMVVPDLFRGDGGAPGDCVLNAAGECVPGLSESSIRLYPTSPGPVLTAEEACRGAAYLCAGLETENRIVIRRWRNFSGTIVVHIPVPRINNDAALARRLQRAAAAGVRLWNGQPFEILVDDRGNREAHFAVQWNRGVSGNQIGVARTRWNPASGLEVLSLQLATRNPFNTSQIIDPRQVRLTAMHEMGHALGLTHSDSPRDVMYPTNTATSLSAQDYVAMEALYRLEDGTEIVR